MALEKTRKKSFISNPFFFPSVNPPKKLNSIFGKSKKNKGYWKDIAFAITLYNDVARSVSNLVVVLAKRHRVNRHGVADSSTLKNQNNNNIDSFSSISITTTPISSFFSSSRLHNVEWEEKLEDTKSQNLYLWFLFLFRSKAKKGVEKIKNG